MMINDVLVREVAAPDVGRMGIEILSFTIKDVYDNVTYLASLGTFIMYTMHSKLSLIFNLTGRHFRMMPRKLYALSINDILKVEHTMPI